MGGRSKAGVHLLDWLRRCCWPTTVLTTRTTKVNMASSKVAYAIKLNRCILRSPTESRPFPQNGKVVFGLGVIHRSFLRFTLCVV